MTRLPVCTSPVEAAPCVTRGTGFTTTGTWFGPDARPLAGWWTTPDHPSRDGVVIAAPFGYEYWSTHRSLRTLAEALASAGWNALRFDWDGTGDSAGEVTDPDRVGAWRASLASAVAAMRDVGIERISLVGLRLGATFALLDAAALGIEQVVACAPLPGKRFAKELRLLGIADPARPGDVVYAGLRLAPDTVAGLDAINLAKTAPTAVPRSLLVTAAAAGSEKLVASLRAQRHRVDVTECPRMQDFLEAPAADAKTPDGLVESIVAWLGPGRPAADALVPPARAIIDTSWHEGRVCETFATVGGLAAMRSTPLDGGSNTAVVFLNSGAEPHIGPGRAWVEYARSLALHGHTCFRTDFSGWGESPDEGRAHGRPYDAHCIADTQRIVAALRSKYSRIVLVGLCAGAWVALQAAQQIHVDGVFALNPQLYWQPGDPVEALMTDTHRRRTSYRRREAHGARWKYWSLLDLLGIRPMASRWLTTLRKQRTPVMLSFAAGDDGLTFLRDRCGRRLTHEIRAGYLCVEEVTGIDHPMYRLWRRPAIVEQMLRFFRTLPAAETDRHS